MIDVSLTKWEMIIGAQIGCMRQIESLCKNSKNGRGIKEEDGWKIQVAGALGEVAVAKVLNVHWPATVNTYKQPDIPPFYQIRSRPDHDKGLTIRPSDSDDEVFILVTGNAPHMKVHGWCWGHEGKQDAYKANPYGKGECFFVPQDALHPLSDIPKQ